MKLFFAALITLFMSSLVNAQTYPTIVGEWYDIEHGPEDCGGPWSLRIEPMAVYGAETYCSFDSVRRDEWMVTWTGTCGSANEEWPSRVVATENPDTRELTVSFNTGFTSVFKSCAPR